MNSHKLFTFYRGRQTIETLFRDHKSHGWHWEQGQVTNPEHLERLLVGMALATWITIYAGIQVADEYLARPSTGNRRTKHQGNRTSSEPLEREIILLQIKAQMSR